MKLLREAWSMLYLFFIKKIPFKNALKQNIIPHQFCELCTVPC